MDIQITGSVWLKPGSGGARRRRFGCGFLEGSTDVHEDKVTIVKAFHEVGDEDDMLHITLTEEGLILDVVDKEGEVMSTAGLDISQLEELCR